MNNSNKKRTKIEVLMDFTIINISEGGILIETNYFLPKDTIHFLKLSHREIDFFIKGIVKRVEHSVKDNEEIFKIAFQFIDINYQQKINLKNFINLIKKEEEKPI